MKLFISKVQSTLSFSNYIYKIATICENNFDIEQEQKNVYFAFDYHNVLELWRL